MMLHGAARMASQNPEIAGALAFFRAKKCAYASPMDVARALGEGSTAIHVVDVRDPVAPVPTIIKGAIWMPEREIASRSMSCRGTGPSCWCAWDVWCRSSRRRRLYRCWKMASWRKN